MLFNLHETFISTIPEYPVDISCLVSDFKYSQEYGLKICEVQHGSLSAFGGDIYISGNDGTIAPMIAQFFDLFPMKKWAAGLLYPPLLRSLSAKGWNIEQSFNMLVKNPMFLKCATLHPADLFSIDSYAGIVYADFDIVQNFNFYQKTYPGIIFMNAAILPYWRDKYKMNSLFNLHDELKKYKADWRLYPKKYDPLLSEKIQKEMPCEFYVIKPRSELLANGVIVVADKDLDNTLHLILQPCDDLKNHSDKKYAYWYKNNDDSFIIEKYYESDYVDFPLPANNTVYETEYHYDATMRIACILKYENGIMTYHSLGGFWKLPCLALEEKGTLNDQRISCCKPPFYKAVAPELLQEVDAHMEKAMLLLYEIMLQGCKNKD